MGLQKLQITILSNYKRYFFAKIFFTWLINDVHLAPISYRVFPSSASKYERALWADSAVQREHEKKKDEQTTKI